MSFEVQRSVVRTRACRGCFASAVGVHMKRTVKHMRWVERPVACAHLSVQVGVERQELQRLIVDLGGKLARGAEDERA